MIYLLIAMTVLNFATLCVAWYYKIRFEKRGTDQEIFQREAQRRSALSRANGSAFTWDKEPMIRKVVEINGNH